MRRRLPSLLVVAVAAVLACIPGQASAAVTSCPDPPAVYTGTDATVAAINQQTIDADKSCKAVTDRLDGLDGDVTAAGTQAHTDAGATKSSVDAVKGSTDAVNSSVGALGTSSSPLHVTLPSGTGGAVTVTNWPSTQSVALDSTSSSQLDGIGQSTHGDLWVLIGVIVGCFALDVFLRKVWP